MEYLKETNESLKTFVGQWELDHPYYPDKKLDIQILGSPYVACFQIHLDYLGDGSFDWYTRSDPYQEEENLYSFFISVSQQRRKSIVQYYLGKKFWYSEVKDDIHVAQLSLKELLGLQFIPELNLLFSQPLHTWTQAYKGCEISHCKSHEH